MKNKGILQEIRNSIVQYKETKWEPVSYTHLDVYKRQIYKLSKEVSRVLKEKYEFGTKYNIENLSLIHI